MVDNPKDTNSPAPAQQEVSGSPKGAPDLDQDGSAEAAPPALRAPEDMIPGPTKPFPCPVDFTKPVRCKSGYPVRILAIDYSLHKPVIGVICDPVFDKAAETWHANGAFLRSGEGAGLDLENVPEAA